MTDGSPAEIHADLARASFMRTVAAIRSELTFTRLIDEAVRQTESTFKFKGRMRSRTRRNPVLMGALVLIVVGVGLVARSRMPRLFVIGL